MRIGFDASHALTPDGIGRYTANLLRALAQRLPENLELVLYGLSSPLDPDALRDRFPDLGPRVHLDGGSTPRGDAVEALHTLTWTVPKGYRGPLVYTCYDLTFLSHPWHHTWRNIRHCLSGLLRARRRARFAAISHSTAAALSRWMGVPAERIDVVYPAPDAIFAPMGRRQADLLLSALEVRRPYLLSVGTLEPRKNLRRLLAAYGQLPEELRQRHPLLVAGGGGWCNRSLLRALERAPGVRRLGQVSDRQLVALMSHATLVAYPSLVEGFGLPVAEAMACGAAVLTSSVSSLPEVAGDAARLVDPRKVGDIRDGLAELLSAPGELARLRRLAPAQAARFTWDAAAEQMIHLYRQVAGDRSAKLRQP